MEAYLNDIALPNHQDAGWEQTYGVVPYRRVFEFEIESGKEFWHNLGGEYVELKLIGGGTTRIIKKIRAMRPVPASTQDFYAIEFADIRWAWEYAWLAVQYNIRRKSGDRRIVSRNILGNANVVDDIEYHPATLNPPFSDTGTPWTSSTSIFDAFTRLNNQLEPQDKFQLQVFLTTGVSLNNIAIDSQAPAGLRTLLSNVPQAGVKITDEGDVQVVDRLDNTEVKALENAGPAIRRRQVEITSDYSQICPHVIDVMFGREMELRFDDLGPRQDSQHVFSVEERRLENVLAVTDPDNANFAPGSWVEIERMLEEWGDHPVTGEPLTIDVLRRQYLHPHFLFGMAEFGQQLAEMSGDQSLWINRAASIKKHLYRTYRLPRRWTDRIQRLIPSRVAILDEETGTRAPAQSWQDFAFKYGDRAQRIAKQVLLYRNIDGYNVNINNGQISPAIVSILDQDEAVIRVDIELDAYGFAEAVIPTAVDNGPTAEIGNVLGQPRWFGEYDEVGQIAPELTANHRAAIIFTAVPFAPPNLQRFQHVLIRPGDLRDQRVSSGLPHEKKGPRLVIKVPENLITSRHAWQDDQENTIEAAFGLSDMGPLNLTDALWNNSVNRSHIEEVALALATVIYGGYVDRPIGSRTVHLNSELELTGQMRRLKHVISRQGANTVIDLDDQTITRTLFSVLPVEVQRRLGVLL